MGTQPGTRGELQRGGTNAVASPLGDSPKTSETEEELTKEINMAKGMLVAAKAAQECSAQRSLVELWETNLKELKEKERRNLPVPHQLKSALDRVEGKRKAREAAEKAAKELLKKHQDAEKTAEEAREAEKAEQVELERLQQQVASQGACPMEGVTLAEVQAAHNAAMEQK